MSDTSITFEKDLSTRFLHLETIIKDPKILAHWSFNEGSGFEISDQSGNGLTAYFYGNEWNTKSSGLTSAFHKKGKRNSCIYLNGTNWLQVQHSDILNFQKSFTISAWIRPEVLNNAVIIEKTATNRGYKLSISEIGELSFVFTDKTGFVQDIKTPPGSIKPGIWQHVGIIFEKDKKTVKLIIDGHIVKKSDAVTDRIDYSESDLYIGGSKNENSCFRGRIDELSIFHSLLNPEEIKTLYINGIPCIYTQSRETIDSTGTSWNIFHGNDPVPHPADDSSIITLRFDGHVSSVQQHKPINSQDYTFVPGEFGGAWDASASENGLSYQLSGNLSEGTAEAWIQLLSHDENAAPFFVLKGINKDLELIISKDHSGIRIVKGEEIIQAHNFPCAEIALNQLFHIALSWKRTDNSTVFQVFHNGVEAGEKFNIKNFVPKKNIRVGGNNLQNFHGLIDDFTLSNFAKVWGEVCPRGYVKTESSSLDLRESFTDVPEGPLMHWKADVGEEDWLYAEKKHDVPDEKKGIYQSGNKGLRTLYHPDAYGFNSSFEATVSVDSATNGWLGIFVKSPEIKSDFFSGHTFTINYSSNEIRLATFDQGRKIGEKILKNDHSFDPEKIYQLTLSSVDGLLRGYVDNRNVISMNVSSSPAKGFAGLITIGASAWFDDVHFTALTPPVVNSRKIQLRIINEDTRISLQEITLNAFRWKKRYGLLPWERDYKNPEPPGNIFGPDNKTPRPNPSADWRSEDAANSAVIQVNGMFYYFIRGNPDIDDIHGNAQIGVLWKDAKEFDGLHFYDPARNTSNSGKNTILQGHKDPKKGVCSDDPPRDERFQLNDQGIIFVDGKILMICREFRNSNPESRKFKRLVLGIFDTDKNSWTSPEPYINEWSQMNPDSCYSVQRGLDGTPEITLLRDPQTDQYIILLYHHMSDNFRNTEISDKRRYETVTGFYFDDNTLVKHPEYQENISVGKPDRRLTFGERVFFDNGIWFMHVNSHTEGLVRDWPDRFDLFSTLDPYDGPWTASPDNDRQKKRSYFPRGDEFDPDNGAIWQGEVIKYRNHYYMYYENYHVIDDVEQMYEYYNHPQSGSRVGYAIAN